MLVTTPLGAVRAGKVALATNAFKPLLRRISHYIAPVYDYCMVTEPLTAGAAGRRSAGPTARAFSDIPNQFHYYRLTEDNRILWGGYDAIYYWRRQGQRRAREPAGDVGQAEPALLRHVPAARGRQVHPHRGAARSTRAAGSACSGARAMQRPRRLRARLHRARRRVDAVRRRGDARPARRPALAWPRRPSSCRSKPLPFPPEPFRFVGIQATRWSLDREDRTGKRNVWLRILDRLGLGFDS